MRDTRVLGIILAGAHRWDASQLDDLLPRALMPVAHTPLVCHILRWLRHAGIERTTICANTDSARFRAALGAGDAVGMDLAYFEDWTPRGPAGCLRDAALSTDGERFVVVEGALLLSCDIASVVDEHVRSGAAATVVATRDVTAALDGRDGLVPTGLYVLEREVFEHVPETGYQDIKEVLLPKLHRDGVATRAAVLGEHCPRLTGAASYLAMNTVALRWLMEADNVPTGYRRIGQALVAESARVKEPERLMGAVLIGSGTHVESGVTVVGPTVIGAGCTIKRSAALCRSVLWDRCRVGADAVVRRCLLGDGVTVRTGLVLDRLVCASDERRFQSPVVEHIALPTDRVA